MKPVLTSSKPRQAIPAPSFATSTGKTVSMRGGSVRKTGPIMAVPKPINLPSRRAENNGFDPNLQLVPGGSWGGTSGKQAPNAAQNSAAAAGAAAQKAETAEAAPAALVPRAPWSMQQGQAPPQPRPAVTSSVGFDFPKLGVSPPSPPPAATNRFQPAAPPAQLRSAPVHSWRDDSVLGNASAYRSDDYDRDRGGRYSSNAYQPPPYRAGHGNFFHGDRNRMMDGHGGNGPNPFLTRAWAEDDEGEMDFKQPIVIPATGVSNPKPTASAGQNKSSEYAAGKPASPDNVRNSMRMLDPVEEARLLAKKKQLDLERMEQQLLEQQRRAEAEAAEKERREEENKKLEAQRRAAEEARVRAAQERALFEERRLRAEQERLDEQRREEERRREDERRREEEMRARKREEERMMYRNQPQLMKQSIEIARQRRQQEEERMEAERKAAAEQRLKELEVRCAQKEREAKERMEKEAKERMEREAHERMEREAKDRLEREARENRDREAREQQERERRQYHEAYQQRKDAQDSLQRSDARLPLDHSGPRSPPHSPRNDWDRYRKPASSDFDGRYGSQGSMRRDERGDIRNSWPASRRDARAEFDDQDDQRGTHFQQRDRPSDLGNKGPRKLFDPKQNRFITEDEEPGFLRREMAQREEAREQAEKVRKETFPHSNSLREGPPARSKPEYRPRFEDRKTRDPAERAILKAEALLERRKREQDRREQASASATAAAEVKETTRPAPKPRDTAPVRVRAPPPQARDIPDSSNTALQSDPPQRPSAPRPKSHVNGEQGQSSHYSPQSTSGVGAKRGKEEQSRRGEPSAALPSHGIKRAAPASGTFQSSVGVSTQPPLKDLDLTFGGELLISNSTIGAGVGGLRFGQGAGKDPWAMDPSSENSGKDSWDNWNSAAQSSLKPAWGVAAEIAPPAASLNQIMLEEKLAEERHATVQAAAVARPAAKSGTRPVTARGGRGGVQSARGGSHARVSEERASDRDAEADPNKFASEVATGAADFILGGEDEPGNDKGFAGKNAGGGQTSPAMPVYGGAARWEKAVGLAPSSWDAWSAFGAGDNAFGSRLANPFGFPSSLPQQPMWSTDGFSSNSLWGIQTPAPAGQVLQNAKQSAGQVSSPPNAASNQSPPTNSSVRERSKDTTRASTQPQNTSRNPSTKPQALPAKQPGGKEARKPVPKKAPNQKRGESTPESESKVQQPARRVDSLFEGASTAGIAAEAAKGNAVGSGNTQVKPARGGHRSGPLRPQSAPSSQAVPAHPGPTQPVQAAPGQARQLAARPASARAEEGTSGRPQRESADPATRGARPGRGRGGAKPQQDTRRVAPGLKEGTGAPQEKVQ